MRRQGGAEYETQYIAFLSCWFYAFQVVLPSQPPFPMFPLSPYTVYLIMSAGFMFCFNTVVTVNQVYLVNIAELNPLQLVLLGTVLETSIFIFEIPTGVVADVYSRRLSVIIGMVLIGVGFILEGSVPLFTWIVCAQILWGVGYTFTSGASEAWIADELGEKRAGQAYLRGAQAGQVGALLGIGVSVALASIHVQIAVIGGGICFVILGMFLILTMSEKGFQTVSKGDQESWPALFHTFKVGVALIRRKPMLISIMIISLFYGMFSEGFDRLWTPYLLTSFTFPETLDLHPVMWFGIINAVGLVLAIIAIEIVNRRIDTNNHRTVVVALAVVHLLTMAGILVFARTDQFSIALAVLWTMIMVRRMYGPLLAVWINPQLAAPVRATVLSIRGQMDSFGQMGGGPILGAIATLRTIPYALIVSVVFLIPALGLYVRSFFSNHKS